MPATIEGGEVNTQTKKKVLGTVTTKSVRILDAVGRVIQTLPGKTYNFTYIGEFSNGEKFYITDLVYNEPDEMLMIVESLVGKVEIL